MARKEGDTNEEYLKKCRDRYRLAKGSADAKNEASQYVTDALMTLKLVRKSHDQD
jgi:hypothetical protein